MAKIKTIEGKCERCGMTIHSTRAIRYCWKCQQELSGKLIHGEERNCNECIHRVPRYSKHYHAYIECCDVWDCKFEQKEGVKV